MLDLFYEHFSQKYKVLRVYGDPKQRDKVNSSTTDFDIIIGTEKLLTAAFDVPILNTVINTVPFVSSHNIEQLKGRVARDFENEEYKKTKAYYILLVDRGFREYEEYCHRHLDILEELGYKIKVIKSETVFEETPVTHSPSKNKGDKKNGIRQ
jgi:superfamily II DNA or RNA helicase